MKKLIALILLITLLAGCAAAVSEVRIAALKGPTAMGMAPMITDSQSDAGSPYAFTLAGSADEITGPLIQGRLDIAAVPANLAAVLYNNTQGAVKVLAINTLGVLYIAERGETILSVSDLAGRTIYTAGKGSTPEYALNFILRANGLEPGKDVFIEFKSEHAECLAAMLSDASAVAMLPQPFVTTAQTKAEDMRVALDLTEEWDRLNLDSAMITGVVIGRSAWIDENPEAVNTFLADYEASVAFVNENNAEAARMIGDINIVPTPVAEKALPHCNITFIAGEEMKTLLNGYYEVLFEQDPKSVGGRMPDENIYYAE
ncbi:MAG: ABC transporter substrate-binding protein [Clostridia bacterium]|nr:ABC transporter substrate-binding protein [Clostridia bacterium]